VVVVTHSLKYLLLKVGILLFLLAGPAAGAEGDLRVSRDHNIYFKHDGGKFSHYLELRGDGSYRRVARGHLYIEERDRGRWQQSNARKLLLRSDQHFRNISSGDLLISMWQPDRLKTLPDLRQRIQNFLKANRTQEFLAEDVERIRETAVSSDPNTKIGDIMVLGSKRVHRSDVEKLLVAIDTFLPSGEKNLFTLVPLEYKTSTIFVDDDRAQLAKSIITDELAGSSTPAHAADKHGYHEIDAAQFDKEMKDAQPALSQPEMNHREKQAGQD
jgi:hypothetical protein